MVGWEGKIIEEAPKSERKARKGDGWGGARAAERRADYLSEKDGGEEVFARRQKNRPPAVRN